MDRNNRGGYTLLELMIVIGIVLAGTGVALARFGDFTTRQKLREESKKFFNVMAVASKKALTADASASCTDFQGYQVNVITTGSYNLKLCCETACNSAQSTTVQSYTLPSTITLTAPTSNTTYLFNKVNQQVTMTPSANQTITLRSSVLARCISITVTTGGLVSTQSEVAC